MNFEEKNFAAPPQAIEVEKSVIGAMLFDGGAVDEVRSILKPQNFYLPQHEVLCQAIFDLDDAKITPDLMTVSERLKQMKRYDDAGRDDYLLEISSEVVSAANVKAHAEIVLDRSIRRTMLGWGASFYEAAKDQSIPTGDLISKYDAGLLALARKGAKEGPTRLYDAMPGVMDDIERRAKGIQTGMTTGFRDLDEKLEAIEGGRTIVIGGIPGSGKTLLGMNIAMRIGTNQKDGSRVPAPGLFISGEMSKKSLGTRILTSQASVAARHLKRGTLPQHEYHNLTRALLDIKNAPVWIDEPAKMTPSYVRSTTRKLMREVGIKWVMVDYFQLMTSDRRYGSRYEEMTQASVDLLRVAIDLDIPIFVMAQLDKDSSKGGVPTMGNVKETGQLIQDAHSILLMHRPSMFEKKVSEQKSDDPFSATGLDYSVRKPPSADEAFCIIEKNRDGETGSMRLKFNGSFQRFEDWGT